MMSIASKNTYLNKDISYMRNIIIREYDLKDGGFSIIKRNDLLPQHEIDKISRMGKKDKNIYIGNLHFKYRGLSKKLVEGFKDARVSFYNANSLQGEQILSIKKDAMFLIDTKASVTDINEHYTFSLKNKYTSYMYLRNIELYYSSYTENLDIKGISKDNLLLHSKGLLLEIKRFIRLNENLNIKKNILFNNFLVLTNKYKNRDLDISYYREFNANSLFRSNIIDTIYMDDYNDVSSIDISYNYGIIIDLMSNIL